MSAPILWILFPAAFAIMLWFIRSKQTLSVGLAGGLCFLLAVLALILPIDRALDIRLFNLQIKSSLVVLGRSFILNDGDRYMLALIYALGTFWLFGARIAGTHRQFSTLAVIMMALLVAALSVKPFLYSALLIELAVLVSIPMLVPPGKKAGRGVLRYLIFQSLAMPFILFAGWAAATYESNPSDQLMLTQAIALLALGFALWLAVFPFYTWVPLLSAEAFPFEAGFVLSLMPLGSILIGLDFLDSFAWLRTYPYTMPALQLIGVLMVVTGGVFAAFQRDLRRIFGYAVIFENGFALLAISLNSAVGYQALVETFLPRGLVLAVWALALGVLVRRGISTELDDLQGVLHRYPFATLAVLMASFSVIGIPLLATFPARQVILENLAIKSPVMALWAFVGVLGFLLAGLRLLYQVVQGQQSGWQVLETRWEALLLAIATVSVMLIGILPRIFLTGLINLLGSYPHLF